MFGIIKWSALIFFLKVANVISTGHKTTKPLNFVYDKSDIHQSIMLHRLKYKNKNLEKNVGLDLHFCFA